MGFLRGCLRRAGAYASERKAFEAPIGSLQAIQLKLGLMATDYAAARALLAQAVRSFQAGGGGDPILLAAAKLFASNAAMHHAVEAVQVFGGYGMHREYEIERLDARRQDHADLRRDERDPGAHGGPRRGQGRRRLLTLPPPPGCRILPPAPRERTLSGD